MGFLLNVEELARFFDGLSSLVIILVPVIPHQAVFDKFLAETSLISIATEALVAGHTVSVTLARL